MVGLRKQLPSYQRSQSSFHFDLEALPSWSLRVDDDAVHKRSEIVDQGTAVVLCASPLRKLYWYDGYPRRLAYGVDLVWRLGALLNADNGSDFRVH